MNVCTFTLNFSILIILFSSLNVQGQSFEINGTVLNASDSRPVEGALIRCNDHRTAVTDKAGKFTLRITSADTLNITASCLGFSPFAQTINQATNSDFIIQLQPTAFSLKEIEVSSGSSAGSQETVASIDVLLRPVNTSQELLTLVPGLLIAQHAGGGKAEQIFLRGFDSDHGTDFNISVDGMPVNMVSHAHGQGYADFHFVIPETIEKLNVFKGPYNARFGDFSTSGTGEFFTKNYISKNEIKAEAGMFDSYRTAALIKLTDNKNILFSKNEHAYIAGEYVFTNSYFDQKQNFNRYNLFSKYSANINERNFLTLSASTFYAKWDASGQIPERAVDEIGIYGSIDPSEGGSTSRSNINLTNTTTSKNGAVLKNQVYYVNYFFNLYSNFTFFLNDPVRGDGIAQTDSRDIFGYNVSWQKEYYIGKRSFVFTSGAGTRNDFTSIKLRHAQSRVIFDTIASGNVKQQNSNGYFDFDIRLTKKFSVNPGFRYDYFIFNYDDQITDSLSGNKSLGRTSPKLNFQYNFSEKFCLFLKSGIGFHSNDARSVVINNTSNSLPRAYGYEVGSEVKILKNTLIHVAAWSLYLESELIFVGDEGTVETNNPTQRYGIDLSIRTQLSKNLYTDIDFNYNHGRLMNTPEGENFIPLAPPLTTSGGITYKKEKGFNSSLRYRFMQDRPANEINSVTAKGHFLIDATIAYCFKQLQIALSAENLLNTAWNQAQFDTESRLYNESDPVSELHFTPGTPFFLKSTVKLNF